jgi:threonine/homoserine/homoserine lactone efflux protein
MTGIRTQLPAFILGYTAILAVPGPNMLALGGLAALRGFHAAAPFALGAASGATALAVVTQAAVAVVAQSSWVIAIRGAGTLLLVVLAMRILRSRAITDGCGRASNSLAVEAGTGFCTAIGNPVTIAYFTAEYASFPAAWPIGLTVAVLVAVPLTSATFYLGICALLAAPGIRRAALMRERLIRWGTASVLLVLAMWAAWGTMACASGG